MGDYVFPKFEVILNPEDMRFLEEYSKKSNRSIESTVQLMYQIGYEWSTWQWEPKRLEIPDDRGIITALKRMISDRVVIPYIFGGVMCIRDVSGVNRVIASVEAMEKTGIYLQEQTTKGGGKQEKRKEEA